MSISASFVQPWIWQQPSQLIIEDYYKIWREERREKFEQFTIENVRFLHDPRWKDRWLSIEGAANPNHIFWGRIVRPVFMFSLLTTYSLWALPVGAIVFGVNFLQRRDPLKALKG